MKKILTKLIFAISLLIPTAAFAHEQWFGKIDPLAPMPEFFTTWSVSRIAFIVGFFVLLAVAVLIRPFIARLKVAQWIENKVTSVGAAAPQLLRGATGILMIVASTQSLLFAPDLHLDQVPYQLAVALWVIQYAVGFAFVLGMFVRPAAVVALALYGVSFAFFPLQNTLSYLSLAGIFTYLFFIGNPDYVGVLFANKLKKIRVWLVAHEQWGFIAMRTLFGLSFIAMGIAFKMMAPQLSLGVIAAHPLNFMAPLGFTNEMFVYACGLAEILFGVLYIFNILPRISSFKLIFLFTATIFVFGLGELFGHLPLLAGFFTILTYQKKKA